MKVNFPTVLGMITVSILCIFAVSMTVFGNDTYSIEVVDSSSKSNLERNAEILSEINKQAIIHQRNNEQEKFDEQTALMQENLKKIASDSLGINITMSDVFVSYFPLVEGSKVEILKDRESFQVCDIVENIPIHLQEIRKAKMFQIFAEKYSEYPIELFLLDERRNNASFHYGLIATSDDGKSALTYFHADSCTNEITDFDNYYLSCRDMKQDYFFSTKNYDDIFASLNHEEFCIIPLDDWRQSVYDYRKTLSDKMDEHIQKLESVDQNSETVMEIRSEIHRLELLSNLLSMIASHTFEDKIIHEKIQEYDHVFGSPPDELLELLEQKK